MGEVYRARDLTLKRDIALKVLPETLAEDRERLSPLQREAEVLASLNHPRIAQVYGIVDRAIAWSWLTVKTSRSRSPAVRSHAGAALSETIAAVLKEEPPFDQLPSGTPPALVRLLRHCLERSGAAPS